jgi:hypothetical protein
MEVRVRGGGAPTVSALRQRRVLARRVCARPSVEVEQNEWISGAIQKRANPSLDDGLRSLERGSVLLAAGSFPSWGGLGLGSDAAGAAPPPSAFKSALDGDLVPARAAGDDGTPGGWRPHSGG